jgi:hypothetical protein
VDCFVLHTADKLADIIKNTVALPLQPRPESIERFIESQTFMIWLLVHPISPPPLLPSVISTTGDTQEDCEKERQLVDCKGKGGDRRSRILRPQESMVLCKSFNTLLPRPSSFHPLIHTQRTRLAAPIGTSRLYWYAAASIDTEPPLLVQRCNGTTAGLGY